MDWSAKIFAYCERGVDPGFWAEPLNAVSNAAFLLAAGMALSRWWAIRERRGGTAELALIALAAVIGIGSFLFHTLATRWAAIADTAPIGAFMLAYLVYALAVLARLPWVWTASLAGVFITTLWGAALVRCYGSTCFNGSLGYAPALLALGLVGAWLWSVEQPAGTTLLTGTAVFAVSLVCRTLDRSACGATTLAGAPIGTHFLWHLLNAALLYILLRAAVDHRGRVSAAVQARL